jgi:hypothetical protein
MVDLQASTPNENISAGFTPLEFFDAGLIEY